MSGNGKVKPLEGIRVLGVENQVAGPYCTMMLAAQGAEVIKIEAPGRGDSAREMGPIIKNDKGDKFSGYFLRFNRNKKGITLDINSDKGKEIFKELVKKSDVVVENFRPGFMDKNGIGYKVLKEINPRLIYAAISGFGQMEGYEGPYQKRTAFDMVVQAMGGLMHNVGEADGPPNWLGIALGDLYSGVMAAYGILLAIITREKTGEGQFIDSSMYDNIISLNERALTVYSLTGKVIGRGQESLVYPIGPFKVKDGYIAMIIPIESIWARLCETIGRPELANDERFNSGPKRAQNKDQLQPILDEWLKDKTKKEAEELLLAGRVPVGIVQDAKDIFECPHANARKMFPEIEQPPIGKVKVVDLPLKMSGVEKVQAGPAPLLGQHTDEVLTNVLNLSSDEIAKLREEKVI
ncbi:MAG: CoA transferase [Candidatus Schekmanbacteria bacterium]|nr:MAG: CoA transferase [Candidatus Schekmanbacteria bacterium]